MADFLSEFAALARRVKELADQVRRVDRHFWATVATVNPLTIRLDDHPYPVSCAGGEFFPGLNAGDRVEVRLSGTLLTVVRAKPTPPPPPLPVNTIRINGKDYPASGSIAVQVGSFAYWDGKIAATTLQIPFPCDLPSGWSFEFFTIDTSSFTESHLGSVDRSNRRCQIRVIQFYSNHLNALSRVGWRLVKE